MIRGLLLASHPACMLPLLQESYEDGACIVHQDTPGDSMFVVQSGEVIARHRATGDVGSGTEVRCRPSAPGYLHWHHNVPIPHARMTQPSS